MISKNMALLMVICMLSIVGCKPDLVVKDLSVTWVAGDKTATAEIANTGKKDAGRFLVYFNGMEEPLSESNTPQVRIWVEGLAKKASVTLTADFAPLAHADNSYLGNVHGISVTADELDMVGESDESNNHREVIFPETIMQCVDFEQEVLGRIYHTTSSFEESEVEISFQPFQWSNGIYTDSGFAEIEGRLLAGYSGQDIEINNINIAFGFGHPCETISLYFGEYGGNVNIEINREFRNIQNLAEINAAVIGGVSVFVVNGNGNDKGFLELAGTIQTFAIGGQELWLDHVCYK